MRPVTMIRRTLDIPIRELSRASGFSTATISLVESGKIEPSHKFKRQVTSAIKTLINKNMLFDDEKGGLNGLGN